MHFQIFQRLSRCITFRNAFRGAVSNPDVDSPDCCTRVNKIEGLLQGWLTDGSYMVNSVMLGPFFCQEPLKVLRRTTPRLALKEIVEIANRVCHERIWGPSKLKPQYLPEKQGNSPV